MTKSNARMFNPVRYTGIEFYLMNAVRCDLRILKLQRDMRPEIGNNIAPGITEGS